MSSYMVTEGLALYMTLCPVGVIDGKCETAEAPLPPLARAMTCVAEGKRFAKELSENGNWRVTFDCRDKLFKRPI